LRLVSAGAQFREVAEELGLGEETVRSHLKKAQSKLGARNRTQAVAEALRQNLIPWGGSTAMTMSEECAQRRLRQLATAAPRWKPCVPNLESLETPR
jgi:predicted transcriptional regulator